MKNEFSIRTAFPADLPEILELFVNTISEVCSKDYTARQIAAWTSSAQNNQRWLDKIDREYFLIACHEDQIVGFGSIEDDYLDLMYAQKDFQGRGIASLLLQNLEAKAVENSVETIYSHVSKTARPFFEKKGYKVSIEQENEISGALMTNFRMQKKLNH